MNIVWIKRPRFYTLLELLKSSIQLASESANIQIAQIWENAEWFLSVKRENSETSDMVHNLDISRAVQILT